MSETAKTFRGYFSAFVSVFHFTCATALIKHRFISVLFQLCGRYYTLVLLPCAALPGLVLSWSRTRELNNQCWNCVAVNNSDTLRLFYVQSFGKTVKCFTVTIA